MTGGIIKNFVEWVIHNGGLYVLLFIVFAETGLLLGFFLPGDSLLFAAGIYSNDLSAQFFNLHYVVIIAMVIAASITGSLAGYLFGYKTGHILFERNESLLFKRKHLLSARNFYDRYGKGTVFISKFLPVIRTFAPIIGGITKMKKNTFMLYNIIGSICWVSSMMLAGHYLQSFAERKYGISLKDHIEGITIAIILITTLPILFKLFSARKKQLNNVEGVK